MASPLQEFNQQNNKRWDILIDFPDWEKGSILEWIRKVVHYRGTNEWGNGVFVYTDEILIRIQKNNRLMLSTVGLDISSWQALRADITESMSGDTKSAMILLELLVKHLRDTASLDSTRRYGSKFLSNENILKILDNTLQNGSKWQIVFDQHAEAGLVERVNPHIRKIAEDLKNNDLENAWSNAFGLNPDAKKAIEYAQSAVEHFASKYELTNANTSVYNVLLGDLKSAKGNKYLSISKPEFDKSIELTKKDDGTSKKEHPSIDDVYAEWFSSGLDIIQKSNPTRHKNRKVENFEVSVEAARQATLIATLYCELIKNKYIHLSK